MFAEFTTLQLVLIALIFVWTGFVRTGLGFGGGGARAAAHAVRGQPAALLAPRHRRHLLFFSGLTLNTQLGNVDWSYLRRSSYWIIPAALAGVFGLLNLPNRWLLMFIDSVTLIYAVIWVMNWAIVGRHAWLDKIFPILGGYIAGASLTGAPLIVAVYMRNIAKENCAIPCSCSGSSSCRSK